MTAPTTDQLAAVAYLTHSIRPDWDRNGIESVLRRLVVEDLAAITHAAITAAATRTAQPRQKAQADPWSTPTPATQQADPWGQPAISEPPF